MPITSLPKSTVKRAPKLIRDQVAEYLRTAIFQLTLEPGTPLIEREICEATSASRATVREALRQLESEGLVRSVQGRGTIVIELTTVEAMEIYQIRVELEALATRLFVERASDEQVEALRESTKVLEDLSDSRIALVQERSFYDVLITGAGSGELQRILQDLRQRIALAQANSLSVPGRNKLALKEYQAIVAAISNRDAEEAARLTVEHIREASRAFLEQREGDSSTGTPATNAT